MTEKKERFFFYNTLACMLSGAIGNDITIDMKNETNIFGLLKSCDGYMNMIIADAVLTSRHGDITRAELVNIKGSNVRYVHMPPQLNPVTIMTSELKRAQAPRNDKFQPKKYSKSKKSRK